MVVNVKDLESPKLVCLDVEGTLYAFTLPMLSRSELKELKGLLLNKIHALCVTREVLYDQLAMVNGELDRRTNMGACKTIDEG